VLNGPEGSKILGDRCSASPFLSSLLTWLAEARGEMRKGKEFSYLLPAPEGLRWKKMYENYGQAHPRF
jgi:hypothetical protein